MIIEWTKEDLLKLLAAMKNNIPSKESERACYRGSKSVDWDKVAFPPFSPELCQEKWEHMTRKVGHTYMMHFLTDRNNLTALSWYFLPDPNRCQVHKSVSVLMIKFNIHRCHYWGFFISTNRTECECVTVCCYLKIGVTVRMTAIQLQSIMILDGGFFSCSPPLSDQNIIHWFHLTHEHSSIA